MKTCIKKLLAVPVLAAVLGFILAGQVAAQTFTNLHSFTGTGSDGGEPMAGLVLSGSDVLYGTASATIGGLSGNGTVFAVNIDGTGFTNLHNFTATSGPYPATNSDGASPNGGLSLSGNVLYGTAAFGGSSGNGTVFKLNTDGTGFMNLHSFTELILPYYTNSDGGNPYAGLILWRNTLYGTAYVGGGSDKGTVFAVNTDGTGFTNLHAFTATSGSSSTNSDGANPYGGLILSGNTLYGAALYGGSSGNGTVFAVNIDGSGFTNLHSFTQSDGGNPYAGLILSGNVLYGTANVGGSSGNGTVFKLNTDGTGFMNLHSFTATELVFPNRTNSDGASPYAGLSLSGSTLYGTTHDGGHSGTGTAFAVNTDGEGFTTLHTFSDHLGDDGAYPYAGLILLGNTLYGTTYHGGSSGYGTVFSLSFTPQQSITPSGTNVILSWPTNYAGFDYTGYHLQSTTNLASPLWTTNLPTPVVVNGLKIVPNPISGERQFFRLSK